MANEHLRLEERRITFLVVSDEPHANPSPFHRYTGYPMWYTLTALQKLGKPYQYIIGPSVCWLGDLIGAIMVSGLLCVASGSLTDQPYRSAIMEEIRSTIVEETFGSIMLKAVGCGWLVRAPIPCLLHFALHSGRIEVHVSSPCPQC